MTRARTTSLIAAAVVAAVVVGLLASKRCSSSRGADKAPVKITIGFRPTVVVDMALIQAVESGAFQRAGIEVNLRAFGRADLLMTALQSGEVQGSAGFPLEPLLGLAEKGQYPYRGYLIWYFDAANPYDGFVVRKDSAIQTVADLSQRKIASHPSRQVHYFVSKMAPSATVSDYNPATPLLGLAGGSLDAAFVLEPALSQAAASGNYRIIETGAVSRLVFGGTRVPAALSLLSQSWIDANPETAASFVRIAQNAQRGRDPAKAAQLLSRPDYGGYPPVVTSRVVEPTCSMPRELDRSGFARFVSALQQGALPGVSVDIDRLLYQSVEE